MVFHSESAADAGDNDCRIIRIGGERPPAFDKSPQMPDWHLQDLMRQGVEGWLAKTASRETRRSYAQDLGQFLTFCGIAPTDLARLSRVLPQDVAAFRDALKGRGRANATVRRKLTALRSLFSYLQLYGYTGANPAHGKFVSAPPVSRDGKTPGLSDGDCRKLLDAPDASMPAGIRDRAILGVLAYSACRVGELVKLDVGSVKQNGEHRVLMIEGKGGKGRMVPLHPEAAERLMMWIEVSSAGQDLDGPLFRPLRSARGFGWDGFQRAHLTARAVQNLVKRYAAETSLDPAISVHSLRVTALTSARERGADIIDLQDFAGHADPRTTLTYIRTRSRLSHSPAYVLRY